MINIINNKDCCGCSACVSICPKHCIMMTEDEEGFLYPKVNGEICIDCGLCERVCNELNPYNKREPIQVLAAINKDEEIREKSSSGGVFYIIAEKIISKGGVVFGARFDKNWQVVIDFAEDMKGVESFMGSKYVQARMDTAYIDVKRFLDQGRMVLFSGTPCQVAGLHKYLRKSYENLITVDFICHGVPSPKVWRIYLDGIMKEYKKLCSIEFRNKKNGWKNFNFKLGYNKDDDTISLLSPFSRNHYMKAFLHDIILRPSCYDCKVKGCSSMSDITIADFWGVNSIFPKMDDDKGTSLVFINTDKGKDALDFSCLNVALTDFKRVIPLNSACCYSPKSHPKRNEFFSHLGNENLIELINDYTKPTLKQRIRNVKADIKLMINRMLIICNGGGEIAQSIKKTERILRIYQDQHVVSICFRSKSNGWKKYNMEIKIKSVTS